MQSKPTRSVARRAALLAMLLLAGAGCSRTPAGDARMQQAEVTAEQLPPQDVAAIAAGYRERLRLGLGSPFRLMELALTDPRLDGASQQAVAAELLSLTLGGRLYQMDPAGFSRYLAAPRPGDLVRGQRHLDVIGEALESAPDPRVGELAVRLAYRIALLEGSVDSLTAPAAMQAAALLRDRALATQDARRLVRTARAHEVDPRDLVASWRRAGHFAVESPALQAISPRMERQAIEMVPLLLRSVRSAMLRQARVVEAPAPPEEDRQALQHLQALVDSLDVPPHATVATTLRRTAAALPADAAGAGAEAWADLTRRVTSEEALAAHYAELIERSPAVRPLLAAAARQVALGLRTFAQERIWQPGQPYPSPADLLDRYGVLVSADSTLPDGWFPPALVRLDGALADLREIVPSLPLRGLRIEVTRESDIENALASHRPRTRTLQWPVTSGPGTLAHEIAHDLDWQAAHRSGLSRSGYASDRVIARNASFAAALATLTPDAPLPNLLPGDGGVHPTSHATRPAEVLARTFEWFVLTRLASRGQWNGTLSSAQDELFTGHGSLRPPGVSEAYGPAVLEALRPLLSIPEAERRGFLSEYGPLRWPRAYLLLRSLVQELERATPRDADLLGTPGPRQRFAGIRAARDGALGSLDGMGCSPQIVWADRAVVEGYRELMTMTAAAHARAVALAHAERIAGSQGRRWMARQLLGPAWPDAEPDPALLAELSETAEAVRELEDAPRQMFRSGFDFRARPTPCGAIGGGLASGS